MKKKKTKLLNGKDIVTKANRSNEKKEKILPLLSQKDLSF